MEQIIRIAMDTSKQIFDLHRVDATEQPVRKLLGYSTKPCFELSDGGDEYCSFERPTRNG